MREARKGGIVPFQNAKTDRREDIRTGLANAVRHSLIPYRQGHEARQPEYERCDLKEQKADLGPCVRRQQAGFQDEKGKRGEEGPNGGEEEEFELGGGAGVAVEVWDDYWVLLAEVFWWGTRLGDCFQKKDVRQAHMPMTMSAKRGWMKRQTRLTASGIAMVTE